MKNYINAILCKNGEEIILDLEIGKSIPMPLGIKDGKFILISVEQNAQTFPLGIPENINKNIDV